MNQIITFRLAIDNWLFNSPLKSPDEAINDTVTQGMRKYWDEYSRLTKQIIIVEPHATFPDKPFASMTKLLRENQNLGDYYISGDEWDNEINPGWWRVQASIDKCKICSTVSIKKHFCHEEDRKCDIYDRKSKFMLFCDYAHLNSIGSKRISYDIVERISNKLIY